MDKEKVLKLAQLARVGISDAEAETLSSEFGAILDYVGEVKKLVDNNSIESTLGKDNFAHKNILREDIDAHESGLYTKEILENAPQADDKYIKVKKILA